MNVNIWKKEKKSIFPRALLWKPFYIKKKLYSEMSPSAKNLKFPIQLILYVYAY
jgi:hypothetical protein